MTYFDSPYKLHASREPLLPLFHTCDGYCLREILQTQKLMAIECPVFDMEPLLYLFYGRPAYKNSLSLHSGFNCHLPVCFILDTNQVKNIKRIYPFDTGAFAGGLYSDYLHKRMVINDFEMSPNITSVHNTVSYFFANNENYFSGYPKPSIDYDVFDHEIEAYHKLINGVQMDKADDRKASIEIQLGEDLPLSGNNVKAVIMPSHFSSSPLVRQTVVKKWKAEILNYNSRGNSRPDYYYNQLLSISEEYIKRIIPIC